MQTCKQWYSLYVRREVVDTAPGAVMVFGDALSASCDRRQGACCDVDTGNWKARASPVSDIKIELSVHAIEVRCAKQDSLEVPTLSKS